MARGSAQADTAATSAQNLSNTYSGNASGLFGALAPMLETEAAHPAGMSAPDLAAANTSAQQSAGGSQAGATGQGALLASRTRNAGAGAAAIAKSARTSGEQLSEAGLQTRLKNATLKQQQQQAGMSGLGNLFSENLSGGNQALGIVPQAVNANTNAENASWDWSKDLLGPLLGAAGAAAPVIGKAFGVGG